MIRLVMAVLICCLWSSVVQAQNIKDDIVTYPAFGKVHVFHKTDKPKQIILFMSGDGGWDQGFIDLMHSVASLDALVAGIDINQYLKYIGKSKKSCFYSASDLESFSQYLQTRYGYDHYTPPVLVGYSSGATLVYGALVQAPPNTFSGVISMGFCPDLDSAKPLCKGSGLTYTKNKKAKSNYIYGKTPSLSSPWVAFQGDDDQVCDTAQATAFAKDIQNAIVVSMPKTGHGFSVEKNWLPKFTELFQSIGAEREKHDSTMQKPASLSDLPLIENAVAAPQGKPLAIIVTGDGGWAGIDRDIGGALNADNINVVGLNSLQYFWAAKTPDQTGKDLSRIVAWYQNQWRPSQILLIGYSLGADVLPFMANRLPTEQQKAIQTIALLGAERQASFSFHVSDWIGSGHHDDDLPIKPEANKLTMENRLCFYGEDETDDSLCTSLDAKTFTIIKTKGDHHFGGDYKALANKIIQAHASATLSESR